MNRIHILSLVLGVVIVGALSVPVFAQSESGEIPSWIKGVANFWIEGGIDDAEFIEALEFLIDENVIKLGESISIDNTMPEEPIQTSLIDEEKRLYELELNQKDDRITILEREVKDTGLDNSHLLNSIVEKENIIINLQTDFNQVKDDFEKYKYDYPLKVGNIGGKLVNADTIRELEQQNNHLEQLIEELEAEIRQLKD